MSHYALRLPDSLYEAAKQLAHADHASLNQFIATAVAEKVSALATAEFFEKRAKRADFKAFKRVLARVKSAPVLSSDRLK